ncbi:MAG TPA: hypothetical protein VEO93_08330 [Gemmatimonadales bacterium]|nr:hypothetical protein [Gemmatimonadales bacterium]
MGQLDDASEAVMRALGRFLLLTAVVAVASAHVGSPDTVFEGAAGPYSVRVVVRLPGVVPGLAEITVRTTGGPAVKTITVLPLRGGRETAALPPADTARAVAGTSDLYTAQLWLMQFGSYSVQVTVEGAGGRGTVLVPVMAVATRRLPFDLTLRVMLIGLGLFLTVGALTIVGAAARDSILDPGVEPDPTRRRRARLVMAGGAGVLVVALWGGRAWWNSEDASYSRNLFHPLHAATRVLPDAAGRMLRFTIDDSAWVGRRGWTPLIPDHGKLMHLFVIRDDASAFAHLHPVAKDSNTFEAALPPLPAGRYRVYADIVHESGFAQTLVDTVTVAGAAASWRASDPDDAWWVESRQPSTISRQQDTLADGAIMRWDSPRLMAGQDVELRFAVVERDGRAAALEPYMGMAAHAVIATPDGSVFVHLHPLGTIATASQLVFQLRQPGDTTPGVLGRRITAFEATAAHAGMAGMAPALTFPYSFPRPGRYRMWVQAKRGGRILTGAFDLAVN